MDQNLSFKATLAASCLGCVGAEIATLPFDTVKVRLQIASTRQSVGVWNTVEGIIKSEGVSSLWKGLSAGLQRQIVYGSLRLSIYTPIRDFYGQYLNVRTDAAPPLYLKILAGVTSGALSMMIASPTDTVKVRLQADGTRPPGVPKRYAGSLNAYSTILRVEGVRGLWVGASANITRNCILNATELAVYDQVKQMLMEHDIMKEGVPLHFVGGFAAGIAATCVGSPVDVLKTRLMNAKPGVYKGVLDALVQTFRTVGFRGFYKGFGPNCLRVGTFNVCCFVLLEQFKKLFSHF